MPQLTQNVSARASRITTLACQHTSHMEMEQIDSELEQNSEWSRIEATQRRRSIPSGRVNTREEQLIEGAGEQPGKRGRRAESRAYGGTILI